jgi:hypothetical protein
LLEVTDNATTSLRKMQVCQPLQSNQWYCHASSTPKKKETLL